MTRDLSSSMRTAILRNARRSVSKVALRHSERRGAAFVNHHFALVAGAIEAEDGTVDCQVPPLRIH